MPLLIKQNVAQQIVEAVKDVCSHDINFIKTNGVIFASTDHTRIGEFHEIGKEVAQSGETIEVQSDNDYQGTKKGVNLPFVYKGEVIAVIGISGNPEEVRKFAYLAQKITLLLLREHELDTREHIQNTQMHQIIRSIVNHEYMNPDYMKDFFEQYNTSLDTKYRTILIRLDSSYTTSNLSLIEQSIYQTFQATASSFYTFNYPNEYILFLEEKSFKQYFYLFEQLGQKQAPLLKIGIGYSASLSHQHLSYRSAKIAVDSLFSNEYLADFDSLDLEILLADIQEDIKKVYLKKTVSRLSSKERELLKIYFSTNMSLKETCNHLYLHKNTLQYQLDKIWRNTGYNPRNFKDAAILYIGLKLLMDRN